MNIEIKQRSIPKKNVALWLGLAIILAASFALRYKAVWFGYPLSTHPDEPRLVETARKILETGDWNPHFFNYPSLNIYLNSAVQWMLHQVLVMSNSFETSSQIPTIYAYLAGRFVNVLLSVATIFVTFEIGRRLLHPIIGLLGALILATSLLHTSNSYVITVDSPAAFWSSLSILMAVLLYTRGSKFVFYLGAGVFAGLAVSSKYTAFLAFIPTLGVCTV